MRSAGCAPVADKKPDHPYPPTLGRCKKAKRLTSDTRVSVNKCPAHLAGSLFL